MTDLSRRGFLAHMGSGLSAVALTHLLGQDGLLAQEPPHAAKSPHFAPRARKVVMIFATGALSHIDTFDYKPELIARHDTPATTQANPTQLKLG